MANPKKFENIIADLLSSLDETAFGELRSQLSDIVYYTDDRKEQIYLLGLYFKEKGNLFDLPESIRKKLLRDIKASGLEAYFTLKRSPNSKKKDSLTLIILLSGILIFSVGLYQIWNRNYWVGIGTRYNTFIVREGGYKLILGSLLIVGGFMRRHFNRKNEKNYS